MHFLNPSREVPMTDTEACAGVPVAITSIDETLKFLFASPGGDGRAVHFCNAYTLSLAYSDTAYRSLLREGDQCLPDGQAVVWVSRILDRRSRLRKVSGPDLFEAAFAASDRSGPRHYLLGGSPETLGTLTEVLSKRFPRAQIVGASSPPFRPMSEIEYRAQDEAIRRSGAEIVWVGLGTPKQDHEVRRIADALPVTAVAVGAAFDFTAGNKKRAPRWMRSAGFEWLHRLGSEPRRLWRRYLVGNAVFLWAAWKCRRAELGDESTG